MNNNESKIMINGELKKCKLQRRSEYREALFSGLVFTSLLAGVGTGIGAACMPSSWPLWPSITFGTCSAAFLAISLWALNDAVQDSSTKDRINILKSIKYELNCEVNRFEKIEIADFDDEIQKTYAKHENLGSNSNN